MRFISFERYMKMYVYKYFSNRTKRCNICLCYLFAGLLSEEQCKARDVRRKQKSTKTKRTSETNSPESVIDSKCDISSVDSKDFVKTKVKLKPETIIESEPLTKVNEDTKKLVEKVVFLQDKYEFPDEQVIKSVDVSILPSVGNQSGLHSSYFVISFFFPKKIIG